MHPSVSSPETVRTEESLDPENWDELRALAHRMVDDLLTYLETVRDRPVWRPIPDEVKAALARPLPHEGEGAERAYRDFLEHVLPHPMGNIHPRFWGWVIGTGTPFGALAEMLAAGMNPNMGGGDHVPNYVESQVLDWCKEMLGYPAGASGLLVSGGSVANLLGLAAARNTRAGFDVRNLGLGAAPAPLTLYGSREMHSSIQKAIELLGLGSESLRLIPTDREFRIDLPALERAIQNDRAAGRRPFCLVGNAGTVNTGATDDLAALADIAAREGLWFHVDGAFGALAAIDPELRRLVAGMERADSVAFDLHKWLYVPIEVGCVLVKDADAHRGAFALRPDYLKHAERGLAGGTRWLSDYGIQLTRGFRALKVWLSLKEHGLDKYARLIRQNVDQAAYLADLVRAADDLELMAPVPLNIVCFRYHGGDARRPGLDALNEELLMRLHESGVAVPTNASIYGKFTLRVAIVNHRSRREDFVLLVQEVQRIGRELTSAPL
jgi:aromatic-L-amino-acid decarboxylase